MRGLPVDRGGPCPGRPVARECILRPSPAGPVGAPVSGGSRSAASRAGPPGRLAHWRPAARPDIPKVAQFPAVSNPPNRDVAETHQNLSAPLLGTREGGRRPGREAGPRPPAAGQAGSVMAGATRDAVRAIEPLAGVETADSAWTGLRERPGLGTRGVGGACGVWLACIGWTGPASTNRLPDWERHRDGEPTESGPGNMADRRLPARPKLDQCEEPPGWWNPGTHATGGDRVDRDRTRLWGWPAWSRRTDRVRWPGREGVASRRVDGT